MVQYFLQYLAKKVQYFPKPYVPAPRRTVLPLCLLSTGDRRHCRGTGERSKDWCIQASSYTPARRARPGGSRVAPGPRPRTLGWKR